MRGRDIPADLASQSRPRQRARGCDPQFTSSRICRIVPRMAGRRLGGLAVALAGLLASGEASASVVLAQTVEQMSVKADLVVRAEVRARMSAWDEAHRRIHTYTELAVTETWVGQAPSTIVVRTLGGEVDGIGMRVSGVAHFEVGEDVVLFLRADQLVQADDQFQLIGLSQGKFHLEQGETGLVARPSAEGLAFARPDAQGRLQVGEGGAQEPTSLSDLRSRVGQARAHAPAPRPAVHRSLPVLSPVAPQRPDVTPESAPGGASSDTP